MSEEREAAERLQALLAKPMAEDRDLMSADTFDPWDLFPALYGSYSSDFDDLAIDILTELQGPNWGRDDLAAEMFREMLCTSGLCDYGSSPRVCFPSPRFGELLPQLLEKWKQYRSLMWG